MKKTFYIALILAALPITLFSMEKERSLPAQDSKLITVQPEVWHLVFIVAELDLNWALQQRRVCKQFDTILHDEKVLKALAKAFVKHIEPSEQKAITNESGFRLPTFLVSLSKKQIECLATFLTFWVHIPQHQLAYHEFALVKFLLKNSSPPNAAALKKHIGRMMQNIQTLKEVFLVLPFFSTFKDENLCSNNHLLSKDAHKALLMRQNVRRLLHAIYKQDTDAIDNRLLLQSLQKNKTPEGYQISESLCERLYYNFERLLVATMQKKKNF